MMIEQLALLKAQAPFLVFFVRELRTNAKKDSYPLDQDNTYSCSTLFANGMFLYFQKNFIDCQRKIKGSGG